MRPTMVSRAMWARAWSEAREILIAVAAGALADLACRLAMAVAALLL